VIALWMAACGWAPTPEGPVAPAHAAGWSALVRAVERSDLAAARVLARDVSLGPVSADRVEADQLAAALGFLQVAEDPDDLTEGLARARAACDACHRALAVPAGPS
jgi:hypothetical protein